MPCARCERPLCRHRGEKTLDADRKAVITQLAAVAIAVAVAAVGSDGGQRVVGVPVFALCVAGAFVIQWLAFVPAYLLKSERFFDLTGSATYILVILMAVLLSPPVDVRTGVLLLLVVAWAARLGTFLFSRIHRAGKDDRFDTFKSSLVRFMNVWTIQGLWVSLTLAAALAAITSGARAAPGAPPDVDALLVIGALVWLVGFGVEVVADAQKSRFRANPANKRRFISTGLWSWSRHPNYFGEIVLWTGIAIIAAPVLQGWQWATLVSPLFVFLLLTRVSGLPMLERKADAAWGGQAEYEAYKTRTPVLVPRTPRPPKS